MRIAALFDLCKRYNLTVKVSPEDPYITLSCEVRIERKSIIIKKYISVCDFEMLEDCMAYLKDEIDREEEKIKNEYNRV